MEDYWRPTPGKSDDGMDPLARVVARDEIRQLAYLYAYALDSRDIDLMLSLFTEDATFPGAGSRRGTGRERWLQLRHIGESALHVTNHIIEFDDADHARGIVYCLPLVNRREMFTEQSVQYRDRYERRDGRWLFSQREHLLWYGVVRAETPYAQEDANWPKSNIGRGTLPYELPTWNAFFEEHGQDRP